MCQKLPLKSLTPRCQWLLSRPHLTAQGLTFPVVFVSWFRYWYTSSLVSPLGYFLGFCWPSSVFLPRISPYTPIQFSFLSHPQRIGVAGNWLLFDCFLLLLLSMVKFMKVGTLSVLFTVLFPPLDPVSQCLRYIVSVQQTLVEWRNRL